MPVYHFSSYEERQERFGAEAHLTLASPCEGLSAVLGTTTDWLRGGDEPLGAAVMLPPNPALGLVFPTLEGDLTAVCGPRSRPKADNRINEVLDRVGLQLPALSQASRTLSGGEICLGMIAKAFLAGPTASHLLACNPEQWLAASKRHLIADLLAEYETRGQAWSLYSLDGESTDPICTHSPAAFASHLSMPAHAALAFTVVLDKPGVVLADTSGVTTTPPLQMSFSCANDRLTLTSPAVWSGPNGVGKSTFGGILAGSVALVRGSVEVRCAGYRGLARILQQNPVPQLFGKTPLQYLTWSFREARSQMLNRARVLYNELASAVAEELARRQSRTLIGTTPIASSLMQARLALVASRLASGTPLLVLDEPGFGLTRDGAQSFVQAVVQVGHREGTAVLILTQTPDWFAFLTRSALSHSRRDVTLSGNRHASVQLEVL